MAEEIVVRDRSRASQALLWSAAGAGLFLLTRAQAIMPYELRSKIALITGGSRGLGLVLARHLVSAGAKVAICARDEEELERAKEDLQSRGGEVFTVRCDLRMRDDVDRMVACVLEHYGQIDVLVNNAGIISVGPLEEMSVDDFVEAMEANFWSGVYTTFAVLPEMRKRQTGRIVNITSIGGKLPAPHLLPYTASKFAFFGFSRGLRSELLKDGIVVTTAAPGLMRTGSPVNANFKGKNRLEYAWFSIADSLPFISMDADRAAEQILGACQRGEVEVTLTAPARIAAALDRLFPEFTGSLLSIANRLLPDGGGIGQRTVRGAQSESVLSPSALTTLSDRAAQRNNEIS
jgi:NAD(P)-dependent dehydrogenase (short-subunit alcohol dehydrogenase family)